MKEVQDHWFRLAKEEGYRSRAAYKLIDIDDKRRVLRRGDRVLDAGAAPGSWSQVAAARVGPKGAVVAVDLKEIARANLPKGVEVLRADLRDLDLESLGGEPFDVVLSDMAPDTTGDPMGDGFRSVRLCHDLLDRSTTWLRKGGNLVMKVFECGEYPGLLQRAGRMFREAKGYKPRASRAESVEMFVVCLGFNGTDGRVQTADDALLPKRRPSRGWGE